MQNNTLHVCYVCIKLSCLAVMMFCDRSASVALLTTSRSAAPQSFPEARGGPATSTVTTSAAPQSVPEPRTASQSVPEPHGGPDINHEPQSFPEARDGPATSTVITVAELHSVSEPRSGSYTSTVTTSAELQSVPEPHGSSRPPVSTLVTHLVTSTSDSAGGANEVDSGPSGDVGSKCDATDLREVLQQISPMPKSKTVRQRKQRAEHAQV